MSSLSGLKIPSKIVRPTLIQKPTSPLAASASAIIDEPPPPSLIMLKVGDRVIVNGAKSGIIAYIGEAKFKEGEWAGVVLDTADGKNNGTVDGVEYFQTDENRGIFCRLNKLTLDTPPPQVEQQDSTGGLLLLAIGDRVIVNSSNGAKKGYLRYIGATEFAKGDWAGVELDDKNGKNDGSVNGKRYFQCEALFGVFAPISKVEKFNEQISSSKQQHQPPSASSKLGGLLKQPAKTTLIKKNLSGSQESINSMKSEQSNISMSASQKSSTLKRPSMGLMPKMKTTVGHTQVVSFLKIY